MVYLETNQDVLIKNMVLFRICEEEIYLIVVYLFYSDLRIFDGLVLALL